MKAIVKCIMIGTEAEDDEHEDEFAMYDLIGKEVEVEPKPLLNNSVKFCKDWFVGGEVGNDDNWNWHRSWLEFVEEPKEDIHKNFDYE